MRKLRKILSLLFIVGIIASMPFGTAMAASRSEDSATESVSEENELSMKQLVSDMESGKVKCVLWNCHVVNRKKHEYKIWINDTYSESGYKVKDESFQAIRAQALKNDIGLFEIPIDGDCIEESEELEESEFDIILKYEKVEGVEARQGYLNQYYMSIKTNLGKIKVFETKKLSEIQDFASKYGLRVSVTNLVRRTILNVLDIIGMSCFGISIIAYIILSIIARITDKSSDTLNICFIAWCELSGLYFMFSFLIELADIIISEILF